MTPDEFAALFDSFQSTAFRWESLPVYEVGGTEQQQIEAFREGRARPERSVRTSPWMARIATSTVAGKGWSRIRVVDDPLTEYQRFQMGGYVESQAVGEQIEIVTRARSTRSGPDFWLFDSGTGNARAVLMHYDPAGRPDRKELVLDAATLSELDAVRRDEAANAIALNEFLASRGVPIG